MLSKVSFWSPMKLNQKGSSVNMSSLNLKTSSPAVGLRILTAAEASRRYSNNIITNSHLKLIKPVFSTNQFQYSSSSLDSCFLKTCFLCNTTLSLDKDVYMYRGDQGFCSAECRSRQIYLDEVKEIEESTKQTLASFRRCRESNWGQTKTLREEFRQRHRQPMSRQKDRINQAPIFTLS